MGQSINTSADNKRLAKNTVFLYFRSIFLLAISLYTSRITLKILGVEDYGIYNIVGGFVAMFSILNTSLSSASQRFITYALGEKNIERQRTVFSTCITLHAILGVIVIVLLEIIGIWFLNNKLNIPSERLDAAIWVFQISTVTLFVTILSIPYNAVVIAHEKMNAFAYISILEGILKLGAVFLLMAINWDKLVLYALFMFLISIINRVIYSIYSSRRFEEARHYSLHINKPLFKEMFAFAGWNLFGNGSVVLRNQGVDIVLNLFFGVTVNAAKGICNQVLNAVHKLVGNFTTSMKPQITKAVAQKNYERTHSLMNNGSRYSFFMMLILTIPIIIAAPRLLDLWLYKVPAYTVPFVRWTMLYLLLDTLTKTLMYAIISQGNIRNYQIIVGGTKLLAIPMVYLMFKLGMSPISSVWANIILEIICIAERLYFSKKRLNFDYLKFIRSVIYKCAIVFALSLGISYLFKHFVTDMLIPTVLCSFIISVLCIWFVGLNNKEHTIVLNYAAKITHRRI